MVGFTPGHLAHRSPVAHILKKTEGNQLTELHV